MIDIEESPLRYDLTKGTFSGDEAHVLHSQKHLKALCGVFADEKARAAMDPETVVYFVEMHDAEKNGTVGGLLFGTSFVNPGKVGDEYFMTQGHFHEKRECAEYYWCIRGEGLLLLQSEDGCVRAEKMSAGTLHYIPGRTAHRLVNTGKDVLAVGACWPSDAGHDYAIAKTGFRAVVKEVNGKVKIIPKD